MNYSITTKSWLFTRRRFSIECSTICRDFFFGNEKQRKLISNLTIESKSALRTPNHEPEKSNFLLLSHFPINFSRLNRKTKTLKPTQIPKKKPSADLVILNRLEFFNKMVDKWRSLPWKLYNFSWERNIRTCGGHYWWW